MHNRAVKQYIAIKYNIFANNNNILGDDSNIYCNTIQFIAIDCIVLQSPFIVSKKKLKNVVTINY